MNSPALLTDNRRPVASVTIRPILPRKGIDQALDALMTMGSLELQGLQVGVSPASWETLVLDLTREHTVQLSVVRYPIPDAHAFAFGVGRAFRFHLSPQRHSGWTLRREQLVPLLLEALPLLRRIAAGHTVGPDPECPGTITGNLTESATDAYNQLLGRTEAFAGPACALPTPAPFDPKLPTDTGGLRRLVLVSHRQRPMAEQLQELGIGVGAVILGRNERGRWWTELRLTLRATGQQLTIWAVESRQGGDPNKHDAGQWEAQGEATDEGLVPQRLDWFQLS